MALSEDRLEELLEKIAGKGGQTDRRKTLDSLKKAEADTVKKSIALVKEQIKYRREEIRGMKLGTDGRKKATEALIKLEKDLDDSIEIHEKQKKVVKSVTSAFTGLYSAMEKGEGTISSFTDGLKGKGVFGTAFSVLGTRLDTNIETFRQLSQTGANFGQSIVSMREAAGEALLPLDDFAALIKENSVNLAALFGSTTKGARGLAELSAGMRKAGIESLAPLGFTVEEINDTLLLNLERQRRTFNFDANARVQNIQSAINLAKQLDRLAKLTGTQREELQKQIEAQMSNERFQAFLGAQSRETGQRLENFAATIGNLSPELTEGFQDLIANSGRPVTDAAIALVQNMPEAQAAIQNLIAGTTTSEQALISIRNSAIKSQDRFRMATVTGTVEFLRLQGGVIKLATTNMDLNSILEEQAGMAPHLTQGLTTFQNATKKLSSQFQMIETGLLSAFGPALGGLADATQGIMVGMGSIAAKMAKVPALTGSLLIAGLIGKYMLDKAAQTAVVFSGTYMALKLAGVGNQAQNSFRQFMKGNRGGTGGRFGRNSRGMMEGSKGGRFGGFARSGLGKGIGIAGTAIGVASSAGMLMDKDKGNDAAGWGGLIGTGLGAVGGFLLGGPAGAMLGASLGSMAGQGIGSMIDGKQHGGPMIGGSPHLVGEAGPEIVTTSKTSNVTSNSDLHKLFDLRDTNKMLASIAASQAAANKIHSQHLDSVNTQTMMTAKIKVATEATARKGDHVSMSG